MFFDAGEMGFTQLLLSMNFPALDPFAVAGNHGEDAGREVISPARSPAESGGKSDGCCLDDDEELAEPEFQEAASADLPIPSRPTSDFFTYASESPANQGLKEEEHVGGDSVETETDQGHSPPGFCHADSSSPEGASVIDLRPRPWKKRLCGREMTNKEVQRNMKRKQYQPAAARRHHRPNHHAMEQEEPPREHSGLPDAKEWPKMCKFVVAPKQGMEFNSFTGSWESGFGISYRQ